VHRASISSLETYEKVDFPFRADHFTLETDPFLQRPKTSKLLRSFECYSPDSERWVPDSITQFTHPMDCKHVPLSELDTFSGSELSQFSASADAAGGRLLGHFAQTRARIKDVLSHVSDGSMAAGSGVDPQRFYSAVSSMLAYLDSAAHEAPGKNDDYHRFFSLTGELEQFSLSQRPKENSSTPPQDRPPSGDQVTLSVKQHRAEILRLALAREETQRQQLVVGSAAVNRVRFNMHLLNVAHDQAFGWLQRRYTNREWQLVAEINRAHERVSLKGRQHSAKSRSKSPSADSRPSSASSTAADPRGATVGPLRAERKPFAYFPGDIVRDRHNGSDGVVVSTWHWPEQTTATIDGSNAVYEVGRL
jgi:hypothetical protein